MKKILFVLVLLFATSAQAQWRHGGGHYYWRPGYGWVVPAVIGGAIVYEATRPVAPNVVVVQPQMPPPAQPVYPAPANMHWEAILDANCNCYKTVLVPN
jgi:hypothetical protein